MYRVWPADDVRQFVTLTTAGISERELVVSDLVLCVCVRHSLTLLYKPNQKPLTPVQLHMAHTVTNILPNQRSKRMTELIDVHL